MTHSIGIMKTSPLSNEQEQAREQMHRSILTTVSHDLKTPLACIIGSLEIFERTKDRLSSEKQDVLIHTALHEAYRLESFINNILDMAKFECNGIKLKKEACEMDALLEDCLVSHGERLSDCEVSIHAIPAPFTLHTDQALLARAICIVVDNAAQYSKPHPVIRIEYEQVDGNVEIRIQDNGRGIPTANLESIFSKYERIARQDYKHAGTGLGLPICREIMRLLGGTVTASNLVGGRGALFTLVFPL
jgi:K+-sensing histidine kinase KdpD